MPSDTGAGLVFDQQRMFERGRLKVREFGRALAKWKQKVREFARLLQPAAIEIVMPAERDGAALAKEAVEFEFLEG